MGLLEEDASAALLSRDERDDDVDDYDDNHHDDYGDDFDDDEDGDASHRPLLRRAGERTGMRGVRARGRGGRNLVCIRVRDQIVIGLLLVWGTLKNFVLKLASRKTMRVLFWTFAGISGFLFCFTLGGRFTGNCIALPSSLRMSGCLECANARLMKAPIST